MVMKIIKTKGIIYEEINYFILHEEDEEFIYTKKDGEKITQKLNRKSTIGTIKKIFINNDEVWGLRENNNFQNQTLEGISKFD